MNPRMDPRTAQIVLMNTFEYLDTADIIRASQVSKLWRSIASRKIYWRSIKLENLSHVDLDSLADIMKKNETHTLDVRNYKSNFHRSDDQFWLDLFKRLWGVKTLRRLYLGECHTEVTNWYNCGELGESIRFLSIDFFGAYYLSIVDLSRLHYFERLAEVEFSFENVHVFGDLHQLSDMKCMRCLSLKNKSDYYRIDLRGLQPHIEHISNLPPALLPRFPYLRRLRLEGTGLTWNSRDVFGAISGLDQLEELELINILVSPNVDDDLGRCTHLKKLYIAPSDQSGASIHQIVVQGAFHLRETLSTFKLGIYRQFLLNVRGDRRLSTLELPVTKVRYVRRRGGNQTDFLPLLMLCKCTKRGCDKIDSICWITLDILRKKMPRRFPKVKTEIILLP